MRNHLTPQEIIANKNDIYLCAKAFRDDANTLMLRLSQKFQFNLNECGAWPIPVYKAKYNSKGFLDDDWTFYLHGGHCRFDNLKTGQAIEVKYTEKPEFGCLDGFFFYTYMTTTDRFKELARWFDKDENVYKALDVLVEEGILTKRASNAVGSYILAL